MGYDYQKKNTIVNWIIELDNRNKQEINERSEAQAQNTDISYLKINQTLNNFDPLLAPLDRRNVLDEAERADRLLTIMGCNTYKKAELIHDELRREQAGWLAYRDSSVGRPVYLSVLAFCISVLTFLSSNLKDRTIGDDPIVSIFIIAASAILLFIDVYMPYSLFRFKQTLQQGEISKIISLSNAISAWLIVNSGNNRQDNGTPATPTRT